MVSLLIGPPSPALGSEVTERAAVDRRCELAPALWLLASFRRTPGQDLQEMQVLLLGDLAAGEPLRCDLLW
jgi:hypothetical protein